MLTAEVFGKSHGCAKCDMLKRRLHALLEQEEYKDIQFVFHDILSERGLVDFLKAEVLNPNRVPALLMANDGQWLPGDADTLLQSTTGRLLGIQTDYSNGGVITPAAIQAVLDKAKELVK